MFCIQILFVLPIFHYIFLRALCIGHFYFILKTLNNDRSNWYWSIYRRHYLTCARLFICLIHLRLQKLFILVLAFYCICSNITSHHIKCQKMIRWRSNCHPIVNHRIFDLFHIFNLLLFSSDRVIDKPYRWMQSSIYYNAYRSSVSVHT